MPERATRAPGFIRVACASNSEREVDGHFGSAERFLVYDVSAREIRPLAPRANRDGGETGDKNAQRVNRIRDCQILCLLSIGGPAAARVTNAGIMPLKFPQGGPVWTILEELKQRLGNTPPPWLQKAMHTA